MEEKRDQKHGRRSNPVPFQDEFMEMSYGERDGRCPELGETQGRGTVAGRHTLDQTASSIFCTRLLMSDSDLEDSTPQFTGAQTAAQKRAAALAGSYGSLMPLPEHQIKSPDPQSYKSHSAPGFLRVIARLLCQLDSQGILAP